MKIIRILDSSGDQLLEFDDTQPGAEARLEAQQLFERLLASGAAAFSVNRADGKPEQKITLFSELENETIVVPRMVGG
jgi:hypothetical protein